MDLYDVLDQIINLLRERKRLTYRLLKRQFDLDDETLDDLKDELIRAQRVAIDEDGAVLVWTGEAERTSISASQPAMTQSDQPTTVESLPPEPSTPALCHPCLSGHQRRRD